MCLHLMLVLQITFHYVFGSIEIQDLALPLIALQYHEVKINMTLDPKKIYGDKIVQLAMLNY